MSSRLFASMPSPVVRRTAAYLRALHPLAPLLLLAACTPGPTYVRPSVDVPAAYQEPVAAPPPGWQAGHPADAAARGDWWTVFGDPQLNRLEARIAVSNQTLRKAVATLQQARAQVGVARADYAPQLTGGLSVDRSLASRNVLYKGQAGHTIDDAAGVLTASWEPDLFDRIGHAVDAADARAQASAADLASVALSLHADLAVDYFNLRQLDAETRLLADTVKAMQQALALVQQRYDGGIASASDLAQAKTELETTQAQLIDLGEARAQDEHAIATLIGVPASSFRLPAQQGATPLPVIPAGVPSGLLQRRPDIAAAERRVAAANADVGEAASAFFPDLMLSASGGLESSRLAQWAALPSRFWAIGPALVGTLFDGGRRRQQLNGAKAAYAGSVADYRQAVLDAFQQVEDNLASLDVLGREAGAQDRAVSDADEALRLALDRYTAGATDYLEVVTAQSAQLADARQAAEIARRRLDASVLLIRNLGGLWAPADPATAMAASRP